MTAATATLALRHVDPPGLLGAFAKLIRWRLVTVYPHGGIVAGPAGLAHATLSDGVHWSDSPADGWLLLPTTVPLGVAQSRIAQRMGRPYDWASLIAFVLPVSVRWSRADYCFEFCWFVLTGQAPTGRVTAEQLLALVAHQLAEQQQQDDDTTTKGQP